MVCHGRGETAHCRSSAAELNNMPRVVCVCVCWKDVNSSTINGGEVVAYKAMIQLDRTRFHERLVSCALLSRFLVSASPESHEENFVQKVTAPKKSFDDGYEVHLCQERKEGCREHVGDEHGEKPLQRAASAYRICNNLTSLST